jgi:hypothetical protein
MGNDRQTAATFLELAPEEIEAQLDRVLASRLFTSAKSCSSFLRFVVKQTLAGQGYRIKESNVGVEVFGRAPGYDPGGDPVVRVRAGRLRARLRDYYASDGRLDPILIDLPKGGYVPVFHRREAQSAKARIAPVRWLLPVVVCVAGLLVNSRRDPARGEPFHRGTAVPQPDWRPN